MHIQQLELTSFRIYNRLVLNPHPHLNLIIGQNAQGKTSILEAIHFLGLTKSHKTIKDTELIKKGAEYAKISSRCVFNDAEVPLNIVISKMGKRVIYNKIEMAKLSDYIGTLNVVMFSPEDLDLVKGSPQERRRFLDLSIGQISRQYVYHLNIYRKLLKERNEVLKGLQKGKKYDRTMLDVLTDRMVVSAKVIVEHRTNFLERLNLKITEVMPLIASEDPLTKLVYEPSVSEGFKEAYDKKIMIDTQLGTTTVGPHRDEFAFYFDEDLLKPFASQGQIRTVVLALKLALAEMIYSDIKVYPVILFDDVFSELDAQRQTDFLKHLNHKTQVFITTTDLKHIHKSKLNDCRIIHIHAGTLKGVETYG